MARGLASVAGRSRWRFDDADPTRTPAASSDDRRSALLDPRDRDADGDRYRTGPPSSELSGTANRWVGPVEPMAAMRAVRGRDDDQRGVLDAMSRKLWLLCTPPELSRPPSLEDASSPSYSGMAFGPWLA